MANSPIFYHPFDCKFPACVFFVKLIFVKLDILDYNITWDVYYVMYGWMILEPTTSCKFEFMVRLVCPCNVSSLSLSFLALEQ